MAADTLPDLLFHDEVSNAAVAPTTSTVLLDMVISPLSFLRFRRSDLVNRPQPIERGRVANEG